MDDVMLSFQYAAYDYGFDFTLHNGQYVNEKTRIAYFWYRKGYLNGERINYDKN